MKDIRTEAIAEGPEAVQQLDEMIAFYRNERINLENKMSNATYAFVLKGNKNWRSTTVDEWDMDVVELEGNEKVIGHRQMDGAICKVLQNNSGDFIALSK